MKFKVGDKIYSKIHECIVLVLMIESGAILVDVGEFGEDWIYFNEIEEWEN